MCLCSLKHFSSRKCDLVRGLLCNKKKVCVCVQEVNISVVFNCSS